MRLLDIRRYYRELLALAAIGLLATGVAAYVLEHQRLRFPWEDVIRIEAEFTTAQSVTPGQGQTVTVAGVTVGDIGEVKLDEGHAVVTLELDPNELGPVYRNARMLLRPKTGLNDMSIQLDPGTPDRSLPRDGRLRDGDRLSAASTAPNVNPDEVLAALDGDTRRYLSILANAGGQGLRNRGATLRKVLKASEPTLSSTARVTRALADRRAKVRRVVTNLRRLSEAAAAKDDELAALVDSSAAVLQTTGNREAELSAAVERLPGALGATRDALGEARGLADELGPTLGRLRPAARALGPALVDIRPLLRNARPIVRDDLRPLVRQATPLVRELRPSLRHLDRAAPDLIRAEKVLTYVANELGYNPPGPEEGYLFWTSWFFHNASSILSIEDAHGATWRGLVVVGCSSFGELLGLNPALEPLVDVPLCPTPPGPRAGGAKKAER